MQIERALTDFIEDEIAYDREHARVTPDEPLLGGVLDSTDMLRLVFFIEETFNVNVEDDQLVPENFESIQKLAAFVRERAQPTGGS